VYYQIYRIWLWYVFTYGKTYPNCSNEDAPTCSKKKDVPTLTLVAKKNSIYLLTKKQYYKKEKLCLANDLIEKQMPIQDEYKNVNICQINIAITGAMYVHCMYGKVLS